MAMNVHDGGRYLEPDPDDENYPELCRRLNGMPGTSDCDPPRSNSSTGYSDGRTLHSDDESIIQIKGIPILRRIEPLLVALARAIQHAPCLEML